MFAYTSKREVHMDMEELKSLIEELEGCCLHDAMWSWREVTEVLVGIWYGGWSHDDGSWKEMPKRDTDSVSVTVVRLSDGRFGLLEESEDYTGHGCQCGAFTGVYPTLSELLLALDEGTRSEVASRLGV